jgi:hypothetical protein
LYEVDVKLISIFICVLTPALAWAEPQIQLPPDENKSAAPSATLNDLVGGGRRLGLGGYGEAFLKLDGDDKEVVLRRFVLFAGYRFTDWARLYAELEVENGNEVEMEQAYLELEPRRWLGFRLGLVIVPLGIINQFHEPPTYPTVDRPLVDQLIIPSTWRELGAGIYGTPIEGLHYQLYAMSGLDGDKFTADAPLVGGRGNGQAAHINDAAVTGRINVTRLLGLDVGIGFYYGGAGQDVKALGGVRAGLVEVDARLRRWGVEARAEYARVFIQGAAKIVDYQRMNDPTVAAVPRAAEGFYANVGYNVLHRVRKTSHELVPFVGYEYVDTHVLPASGVSNPGDDAAHHYLLVGVNYRPHPQIVLKLDYRRTLYGAIETPALITGANVEASEATAATGASNDRVMFGAGFMF